jgi:hypothetical protein
MIGFFMENKIIFAINVQSITAMNAARMMAMMNLFFQDAIHA